MQVRPSSLPLLWLGGGGARARPSAPPCLVLLLWQEGFGWTNGVALQLLDLFGDRLTAASAALPRSWAWIGAFLALLLAQEPL